MGSRVELFALIRRDARMEGLSIRELARRHGVGRPTVRQALLQAEPPPRMPRVRSAPRLEVFKSAIDAMLLENTTAPRKQRHTARQIFARLADEHGTTELSYSTVRNYVRVRRPQVDVDAGRRREVFIPQEHAPGAEAEVDFGEVWVILAGVKTKCHMFTFRLSSSGKAIHRVYSTQGQEAFLEGHIAAFEEIGGIPTRHIRYDNLTAAVTTVIYGSGRQRTENERWVLFRSHYGFDAFYCQPGIDGAHEKGGVEGEVGRFRRAHLSPMPVVNSLDELNEQIRDWDRKDDARRVGDRIRTVGQDFAVEQPLLAPLVSERFDPGLSLTPRVDRSSLIRVRMANYSVPARFINRQVRVSLRASEVIVFDGRVEIARHPRVVAVHGQSVDLDHYLEVLRTKPGAFPGSTALAQARAAGTFTAAQGSVLGRRPEDRRRRGRHEELIDVLLLHRSMGAADGDAGLVSALQVGAVTADVVAVEARRHAITRPSEASELVLSNASIPDHRVISLTQRRLADPEAVIAGLPADRRPTPSVEGYDELLTLARRRSPATTRITTEETA